LRRETALDFPLAPQGGRRFPAHALPVHVYLGSPPHVREREGEGEREREREREERR
jgi:hypothetical protein